MVQLNILSGKKAGAQIAARRFPFQIGRGNGSDLQFDDDGVWEKHLTFEFKKSDGFYLAVAPNAIATVNHQSVQTAHLRNGDVITVGSVKLQFWLAVARQRSLRLREGFFWLLLAAVTVFQFWLIYVLLR